MNKKEKGEISEAKITAELIEEGYTVLQPFGENTRYDLVIDDGNSLKKIQCKSAWKFDEDGKSIKFKTRSVRTNASGTTNDPYTKDEIDIFAVYYSGRDEVYMVPVEETPSSSMTLRYSKSKHASSSNLAHEYRL